MCPRPLFLAGCALVGVLPSLSAQAPVWAIGTADGSGDEFRSGSASALTYQAGPAASPKEWPEKQSVGDSYTIVFSLPAPSEFGYTLTVDGSFLEGGPELLGVEVNGHQGTFALRPEFGPDLDFREGLISTHARIQLRAPLEGSCFQAGRNSLRLTLLGDGGGTLHYDALRLDVHRSADEAAGAALQARVEPTIFYRRGPPLSEVTEVIIRHSSRLAAGAVRLQVGDGPPLVGKLADPGPEFGDALIKLDVPAPAAPAPYRLTLASGGSTREFTGTFRPEKRWKLYAAGRVHNDMGYNDLQENTRAGQEFNTDATVAALRAHPDHAFNLENSWLAQDYLEARNPEAASRLIEVARTGRLGISGLYLNLLTGLCSGEELHRALYFAAQLDRLHGVPFGSASLADTPSQSWSLASVLAESGIDSFALASNQHRGPLLVHSDLNEISPFWWEGPDGKRVLAFYSRGYGQLRRFEEDSLPLTARAIGQFILRYQRPGYVPDALLVYGLAGDNAPVGDTGVGLLARWNAAYAYPKLIAATDRDYFDYVKAAFGSKLPIRRGDGGSYWADGAGSAAAATIQTRTAQRLLPVAEMAASWNSIWNRQAAYPAEDLTAAWNEVLLDDEHSWGANDSMTQPGKEFVRRQIEFKNAHAERAATAARDLLTLSLRRLFTFLPGHRPLLVVVNPGLEPRSEPVEAEINDDRQIVSTRDGTTVPLDVLSEHAPAEIGNNGFFWYRGSLKPWRRVRFLATNVPALGYATYEVRPAEESAAAPRGLGSKSWTIENRYYRLSVDPRTGAIASLYDKELGRELVDPAARWGANELVYAAGGEGQSIINNLHLWPATRLDVSGSEGARLVENVRTLLGSRLRVVSRARNVPRFETQIDLYDNSRRIDLTDHVRKDDILAKEGVYIAFPFLVSPPRLRYETANGWVRGDEDLLAGACRDWFTTQNLVVAEDDTAAVALATPDLPLVTLEDINRGRWATKLQIRNGHVFSYVCNNYWDTNIQPSQGGDLTFHYSIACFPRSEGERRIADFGEAARTPLVVFPLAGSAAPRTAGAPALPLGEGQFLTCSSSQARITAFKRAEDGRGYIVRVLETSGQAGRIILGSGLLKLAGGCLTNGVEVDQGGSLPSDAGGVSIPLRPWAFTTARIDFAGQ